KVGEGLIMMLGRAAVLNDVPFPRDSRIEFRIGIFPPPDFIGLPVAAENEIEIAIAINIESCAAGLDGKEISFEHEPLPACGNSPIPDQSRSCFAEANDEIIGAIFVEVSDHGAGLLGGRAGQGEIASGGGKMFPADFSGGTAEE